jgi:adenine phosphoribosyltransferase
VTAVAAVEARGFLFAGPLALELGVGVIPVRKPGKLPADTIALDYDLEYGRDRLELHRGVLEPGAGVLVVDDVLATGGTAAADAADAARAAAAAAAAASSASPSGLSASAARNAVSLSAKRRSLACSEAWLMVCARSAGEGWRAGGRATGAAR